MVQMLRVMLAKEMGRGGMTEDEYKELVVRMQDNVGDVVSQCQREQEEEEEVQTSNVLKTFWWLGKLP